MNTVMDVSIIIVSYNVCELITKCIQSIYEKVKQTTFEIIVVDNASIDDTVKNLRFNFPDVKLIVSEDNIGFGNANNLGASEAEGKYLLFLNPDTELINDAVSELYLFMESHLNVALCGGNLFTPDMLPNKSYEMFLPGFSDAIAYVFKIPITKTMDEFNKILIPKCVAWIQGADMFMRHSIFDQIGRFDKRFFMYFEEPVLAQKIKNINMDIYSVPSACIIHYEGASDKKKTITTYYYFDSFLKYYHDYHSSFYRFIYYLLRLKIFVGQILSILFHNRKKLVYWLKMKTILLENY